MKYLPSISDAEFEVMDVIWKYAPISTEFMSQIATDNTVKNRISEHMDEIENIIDYTEIADEQQNEEQTENK